MEQQYSFKKNESFSIREGWISKVINCENLRDAFHKTKGISELGIGSNMVKGLKYWVTAADIIEKNKDNSLTEFGLALKKYDKYLEDKSSWFLIHYHLVKKISDCPIFYYVFTLDQNSFDKKFIEEFVFEKTKGSFTGKDDDVLKKYIDEDTNVFLKTYYSEDKKSNPEDNYACPLSELRLIRREKDKVVKTMPSLASLSPYVVYYVLRKEIKSDAFNIDDVMDEPLGPSHIFNLDKSTFIQYLKILQNKGLLMVNRTAGLNTVYFNEKDFGYDELYKKEAEENV